MEKKFMTVQDLIDNLQKIENKNLPIDCTVGMTSVQRIDEGSVLDVENIDIRTNSHGVKPVAITLMLSGIPKVIYDSCDEFTEIVPGKNFPKETFAKLCKGVSDPRIVLSVLNGIKRNGLLAMYDADKVKAAGNEDEDDVTEEKETKND